MRDDAKTEPAFSKSSKHYYNLVTYADIIQQIRQIGIDVALDKKLLVSIAFETKLLHICTRIAYRDIHVLCEQSETFKLVILSIFSHSSINETQYIGLYTTYLCKRYEYTWLFNSSLLDMEQLQRKIPKVCASVNCKVNLHCSILKPLNYLC